MKVLFERVVIKEYMFGNNENLTGDLSKGFSEGVQRRGSVKGVLMFSSFLYHVHVLQRIVYNTYAEMSIILRSG